MFRCFLVGVVDSRFTETSDICYLCFSPVISPAKFSAWFLCSKLALVPCPLVHQYAVLTHAAKSEISFRSWVEMRKLAFVSTEP